MKREVFLFLIMGFVLSLSAEAATFQITGYVRHHTQEMGPPNHRFRYDLVEPFLAQFDGTNWYVRFQPENKPFLQRGFLMEFGWDGRTIRALSWNQDPTKVKEPSLEATTHRSPVPSDLFGVEIGVIWCTLLSGPYFRSLQGIAAEPPGVGCLGVIAGEGFRADRTWTGRHLNGPGHPAAYLKLPVQVQKGQGTPPFDVPQRVIYYDYILPWKSAPKKFPVDPTKLRKAAVFEVLEWTNSVGKTYPARGRLTTWEWGSINKICAQFECVVTNFVVVSDPVDPIPHLHGHKALFGDYRFIPEVPTHPELMMISYVTNRWLTDEEVKATSAYRNAMRNIQMEHRRIVRQRLSRYFVVGIVILVVLPAVYLGLRWMRQKR